MLSAAAYEKSFRVSPLGFVEHEFENDVVRAGLLFSMACARSSTATRISTSIPGAVGCAATWPRCAWAVRLRLADALVADIRQHGGTVRTAAEPRSILVDGGHAVGVELTSGERI